MRTALVVVMGCLAVLGLMCKGRICVDVYVGARTAHNQYSRLSITPIAQATRCGPRSPPIPVPYFSLGQTGDAASSASGQVAHGTSIGNMPDTSLDPAQEMPMRSTGHPALRRAVRHPSTEPVRATMTSRTAGRHVRDESTWSPSLAIEQPPSFPLRGLGRAGVDLWLSLARFRVSTYLRQCSPWALTLQRSPPHQHAAAAGPGLSVAIETEV